MTRRFFVVSLLLMPLSVLASEYPLETIMADPDWIGNQPQNPYFGDSGEWVYFQQKRIGESFNDPYVVAANGSGAPQLIDYGTGVESSNATRVFNRERTAVAWTTDGDVFLRRWPDGPIRQLTRTAAAENSLVFLNDGRLAYVVDGRYKLHDPSNGQIADFAHLRFEEDPDALPDFDTLRAHQKRLYTTVVEDTRRERAAKAERNARQEASPNGAPIATFLGKKHEVVRRSLSPDGQHLILVTELKGHEDGEAGVMPNYVTESGYTETRALRTRVGRKLPAEQQLWVFHGESRELTSISFDDLPGIDRDPLARLRRSALDWHVERGADREQVAKQLEAPAQRGVRIERIHWNADGSIAALQVHAIDNKDRWIVTLATEAAELTAQHRLTDDAWINYFYNDMGWVPNQDTLWYLSEESGYSQLYLKALDARRPRALTSGEFVVADVEATPDGRYLVFRANRGHPSTYEIHRVDVASGDVEQLTELGGVNHFFLSPNADRLGILHSEFDRHPDLFAKNLAVGQAPTRLTDTVSDAYEAIDWVIPKIVEVPSSHVAEPIYTKLYLPKDYSEDKTYPAVMFVHGAGYTQNAHAGWPYYFREFMFHSLLTERGFVVIDMDYRASRGYGRDWRTAIYRQMGHPELEDFLDGVDYLVDNWNVDRERIGIYGGSYGGFMTFMALFREPDVFAAGASLRPVSDWQHYNHEYTSNILNTPLVDPEAYEKSSPIHFADGLSKPLLIAAGMQDDNVFFQDSILMVQRLMELKKTDFELASYPLDPHGFVHADAWRDEYQRILTLMEESLLTP
ncbi:MAG: prolyl oligopeptidase family serine peptidase [Pseudomonadota bacterium]